MIPSYVAKQNFETSAMKVKSQYKRNILLYGQDDFVFDEKATVFSTVFCLQPKSNGKITTTPRKMWECHIVKTDVGKMNLVVT